MAVPADDMPLRALLMAKYPEPGRVKTRLAHGLGDEHAAQVYRHCVERLIDRLDAIGIPVEIHYDPPDAPTARAMPQWLGAHRAYLPQVQGDLGQRLATAIAGAFNRHHAPAFVLGGDCPGLTTSVLAEARRRLAQGNAVIGPAEDGGYYLLGLTQPAETLFRAIEWSTPRVFAQTLQRAQEAGIPLKHLPVLYDIDTPNDYARALADGFLTPCRDFC